MKTRDRPARDWTTVLRRRGRMEAWQKWSFPISPLRQDGATPAGWRPVHKRRRASRFLQQRG